MSVSACSARNPTKTATNQAPAPTVDAKWATEAPPARSSSSPPSTDLGRIHRGTVDLRQGGAALGGGYQYVGERLVTGWHSHDLHQIEYGVSGVVEVETAAGHYLLPPQQAAWIPAGLEHQATMNTAVRTVSVMFDPSIVPHPGDRARILAVSPLIREMMLYALRWPIARPESHEISDGFFRTLAHLVAESLEHEEPLSLPTSTDPVVAAAMAYTREHLETVTAAEVSHAIGVSERTLRRQFAAELSMPWRGYLLQARLLRAMALLAEPGPSVLDVSLAVGFDNVSAFARAFAQRCGETPSAYRRRVAAGGPGSAARAGAPGHAGAPEATPTGTDADPHARLAISSLAGGRMTGLIAR
nr:helix-turn-helix transcriptional regulator [Pseudofrankia asymbiotica]